MANSASCEIISNNLATASRLPPPFYYSIHTTEAPMVSSQCATDYKQRALAAIDLALRITAEFDLDDEDKEFEPEQGE
jgi:hypothetical protein